MSELEVWVVSERREGVTCVGDGLVEGVDEQNKDLF